MADDITRDDDAIAGASGAALDGKAPGAFAQPGAPGADGGINQGADAASLTPEQEALRRRRQTQGDLVDNNAASHQGGIGAQSGQADYGSAGNLAGGLPD